MGDHDSLFKRAFSVPAHAAGELRSVLPEAIAKALDLATLKVEPTSFVDAEMAHRHTDLLFSASISGRPSYVYFLLEHQSEPDALMPFRVLVYLQRIWAELLRAEPKRKTLQPIITIVVHHGEQGWTAPRRFHDLVDGLKESPELARFVPDFELLIDDLVLQDDEALQRRPLEPFPKIALWLLRDARSFEVLVKHRIAWTTEVTRLVQSDPRGEDVRTVLRYILRVAGEMPYELVRQRLVETAPVFEEVMPSMEQLIEKGVEKGRQEGRQEGVRDTLMRTLTRLLRARFGTLEPAVEDRIGRASPDELDRWVERVIVAPSVEDVFKD